MRAAVLTAIGKPLEVETLADPTPGPKDVIVKVGRCGICGSDLHISEDPIFGVPAGVVLGHEYSGEVIEVGREVSRALGGPPEIVFECVGKEGLIQRSIDLVQPRGTVVVAGLCTTPDQINPFWMVNKEVRVQPSAFYDVRDFQTTLDLFDSGVLTPNEMITDHVSLEAMPAAFEALKQRTHQCKVMVKPFE